MKPLTAYFLCTLMVKTYNYLFVFLLLVILLLSVGIARVEIYKRE